MKVDFTNLTDLVHACPVYVSGDTTAVTVPPYVFTTTPNTAFADTEPYLIIQTGKRAVVPLRIKVKATVANTTAVATHALFAIDDGARYSSGGIDLICSKGMRDGRLTGRLQHVANGAFTGTPSASWVSVADFAATANIATYTHVTGSGAIAQFVPDMLSSSLIRPSTAYDLVYTIGTPTGAGLLTTAVSGICPSTAIGRIAAGVQIADTYVTRIVTNPSLDQSNSLAFSATSSAAASFTIDNLSMREAFSEARVFAGGMIATAAVDPRYFNQTFIKSGVWANADEVLIEFTPGPSVTIGPIGTATATRLISYVTPMVVPPNSSFLMYMWSPSQTVSPVHQIECMFQEVGVYGS